jgi:hypothetical protein
MRTRPTNEQRLLRVLVGVMLLVHVPMLLLFAWSLMCAGATGR